MPIRRWTSISAVIYVHADYAGCIDTRRSTTGYVYVRERADFLGFKGSIGRLPIDM